MAGGGVVGVGWGGGRGVERERKGWESERVGGRWHWGHGIPTICTHTGGCQEAVM